MNLKKLLCTLSLSISAIAFAAPFETWNFICEYTRAVSFSEKAQAELIRNGMKHLENKEEKDSRENFYLIKNGFFLFKYSKGPDSLKFVWTQLLDSEVRYDSNDKTLSIIPRDPSVLLLELEDILSLYYNRDAYLSYRQLRDDEVLVNSEENIVVVTFKNSIMRIASSDSDMSISVRERENNKQFIDIEVKKEANGLLVSTEYVNDGVKIINKVRPLSVTGFDFAAIVPPILDGEFIVADFRFVPAVSYLYAGNIPSVLESKNMYTEMLPEEWLKRINLFLQDDDAVKDIIGLSMISSSLDKLSKISDK